MIPNVNAITELPSVLIVLIIELAFEVAAPATQMLTVAFAFEAVKLLIVMLEMIAWVADGTVYKVASAVVVGADWPSTLYVVAIDYAPINRNTVGVGFSAVAWAFQDTPDAVVLSAVRT